MSWLLRKFGVTGLLAIFSGLILVGAFVFIQVSPGAMSSAVWVLILGFAGLLVALVARQVKSRKFEPAFLFAFCILLVFLGVFTFLAWRESQVLFRFSGGGGETTTEVFTLESPGEIYLAESGGSSGPGTPYIKVKAYEEGMSDPIREVTSSYVGGESPGVHMNSVRLDPGSYYLKIESNLGHWKLNIEAKG